MSSPKRHSFTPQDWYRIHDLYERAVTLAADDRLDFVEKEEANPHIREAIKRLLTEGDDLNNFLEEALTQLIADQQFEAPQHLFSPGEVIRDFQIKKVIGSGGFGTVYLAQQLSLDREVALKVSPDLGVEGKTLAYLEHDHIVKLYSQESDESKNLRLVCMQYVPGADLAEIMSKLTQKRQSSFADFIDAARVLGPTEAPPDSASLERLQALRRMDFLSSLVWITARIAEALDFAHQRGICHLDLKPGNILLTPYGRPVLTDFGVALDRRVDAKARNVGGTTKYMSPEHQAAFSTGDAKAFEKLTPAADIYSLAVTLKELCERGIDNQFVTARDLQTLAPILAKATAHEVDRRYASARDFQIALDTFRDLRRIRQEELPEDGLTRLAEKHPFWTLTFAGAIPQIAATFFGTQYNQLHVIPNLTPEQISIFDNLNLFFTPVVYSIAAFVWIWQLMSLHRKTKRIDSVNIGAEFRDRLRRRVLRLPWIGMALTSFSWLSTAIVFPIAITQWGGALCLSTTGHLIAPFILGWMIALSYTYLLHQQITIRGLYLKYWPGASPLIPTAINELRPVSNVSFLFSRLTVIIPLAGAAILLFYSPLSLPPEGIRLLKQLLFFLIWLGGLGVFLALSLHQQIVRSVEAFLSIEKR